jgi:hypothetical protein
MRLSGVEFFPNRTELQKQRSLDEQLGSADAIDLVTIIGRTLHETQLKTSRTLNVSFFLTQTHHRRKITREASTKRDFLNGKLPKPPKACNAKQLKVRWYSHTIRQSFMIGGARKNNGWVQIETVLPFSVSKRP